MTTDPSHWPANTFAGRLHELREAAGLSQYELARRTGLTQETLSKLERSGREPAWTFRGRGVLPL